MKLKFFLPAFAVYQSYAKINQDVRGNFGNDRFVALHKDEVTSSVRELLQQHEHDQFGHNDGFHHIRLSPEGVKHLELEGVTFTDHTEEFLSEVERNLQNSEFVCSEGAEACAAKDSEEFFNSYQKIDSLYKRYENLANANPSETRWETLGTTYEGREQKLLWIGDDGIKPLVYYFCGIHAREWISPMYCAHMAETLLDPNNADAQRLRQKYSFVITPVGNPDGYAYTHADNGDNFWRKTRKPNPGSRCIGTDPNRNYGYEWGGNGASPFPCSDTYRGAAPFDQPITQNIKEFSDQYKDRLIHINDVHAYGEYYLSAWAYTVQLPPAADYAKMAATNQAMFDAIKAFSGLEFKIGPTATTIYEASGGSMDYFYGVNGILYSGSYEARGGGATGLQGFQPPTKTIKESNAELFVGMYAFLNKIAEIEFCSQNEETNIFWESQKTKGEMVMATCDELVDYCAAYPVVSERCPIACTKCLEVDESVKTSTAAVTITRAGSPQTDDEVEEESTSEYSLYVAGAAVFAFFLIGAVVAGVYAAKKNHDKSVVESKPDKSLHYSL